MRLLAVTTGHEGLVIEVLQNALGLVHRSGNPVDASSSGELLDDFDDSLVTLGHLTILFWLQGAGSLFTPPMSARPVAPGLTVQLPTGSSRPWI